jgi:Gpi18-like mannosyltransferase
MADPNKYPGKYVLNAAILLFFIVYLVTETPDLKTAIAVVAALYVFPGSMFISVSVFRGIFHQSLSTKRSLAKKQSIHDPVLFSRLCSLYIKRLVLVLGIYAGSLALYCVLFAGVLHYEKKQV